MSKPNYSFIFPVHNESPYLIAQLKLFIKKIITLYQLNFEIILVENGSDDDSAVLVKKLANRFSFIRSTSIAKPSYGKAIKKGINLAKANKIFILNVDYFDIFFIQKAAHLLSYLDIVIGSKTLSRSNDQRSLPRRLMTYFFNIVLRLVLNYPGTDTHGIKAFRRTQLLLDTVSRCRTQNELFDTELVLRMTHDGAIFVDLPQKVEEVRPSRYIGLRRLKSTLSDLTQAIISKYFIKNSTVFELVDADDYGISEKVNNSIINELKNERVQIVSIMANLVTNDAVKKLKTITPIPIFSLHFNLLRGRPAAPSYLVTSLITKKGNFYPLPIFMFKLLMGMIKLDEIVIEFKAQYEALKKMGIQPTLLNSEQHLHIFSPLNKLLERSITLTTITKIRSIASTRYYLQKKMGRYVVLRCLQLLCNARFNSFTEFRSFYHSHIVHPGTNYD